MASRRRRRKKNGRIRKVLEITFLVIMISLIAAYTAGIFILRGSFLQNTYVNGIEYSNMTAEEAEAFFRTTYTGRTLTLRERGGAEEVISYDDIGYRLITGDAFQTLIEDQNYLAWPLTYLEDTKIQTSENFEYSEAKLDKLLKKLDAVSGEGVELPTKAKIVKGAEGYYIEPEKLGNRILYRELLPAVENAINNAETELDLEAADVYMKPEIYSTDEELNRKLDEIEKIQNTVITIAMEGGVYVTLDKTTFLDWMKYNGTIRFKEEEIVNYTNQLADRYDTYLKQRPFVTNEGDTVMVGGGPYDNYGYLMNRETSAQLIKNALLSGVSQTIAIDWTMYGIARDENGGDFGKTYIEISIDEQHLWYYKEGQLVLDTPVVTGTAIPSRATPTGCFHVLQMLKDHTMQGSYGESFANYVIAIMMNGICIHDSSWRDYYGSDIFYYDGSHGCVNTPFEKVKELYESIEGFEPVIIYDRLNTCPDVKNETYLGGENNGEATSDDEYYYDE